MLAITLFLTLLALLLFSVTFDALAAYGMTVNAGSTATAETSCAYVSENRVVCVVPTRNDTSAGVSAQFRLHANDLGYDTSAFAYWYLQVPSLVSSAPSVMTARTLIYLFYFLDLVAQIRVEQL